MMLSTENVAWLKKVGLIDSLRIIKLGAVFSRRHLTKSTVFAILRLPSVFAAIRRIASGELIVSESKALGP